MGKIGRIIKKIVKIMLITFLSLFILLVLDELFLYDPEEDLGGGYAYTHETARDVRGPKIDIPWKIIDIKFDRRFILVKQRLDGQKPLRKYYDYYNYDYLSLYGDYYWIIDKVEDTFYGPLGQQEYIQKTDSLQINPSKMKSSRYLRGEGL